MHRHSPSLLILLMLALAMVFPGCKKGQTPNVVFILVDDLGWMDLGCYGSSFYDTPELDLFAEQAVRFTSAYSASPVCSPTRASLMTGHHPVRVNITDWIPGFQSENAHDSLLETPQDIHNMPLEELTIAELFQNQGYKTFFAGKWHLGESEAYWPEFQGFDINIGGNHKGSPTFPGGKGYYSPYGNPRMEDGPEGEYLTDRLTEEAIRFIDASGNQPFFLYLSFYTVHTPIQGCSAYDDLYRQRSLALPDSGRMLTLEEHMGITRTNQSDYRYAAMVRSMDANVGRLLSKLEESGLLEETIIIFTSDNGGLTTTKNGGPTSVLPLRAGKGWCYEGGIRVPLLISYPGILHPGRVSHQPVISTDLFSTLLELADIECPEGLKSDGISLLPFLENPDALEERSLVWHYPHYHGSTWSPGSAIRLGSWKLVEFYEDGHVELYDLEKDLSESKNLSSALPELADSLKREMHRLLDEMGAAYPIARDN